MRARKRIRPERLVAEAGAILLQRLTVLSIVFVLAAGAVSELRTMSLFYSLKRQSARVEGAVQWLWVSTVLSGKRGYVEFTRGAYKMVVAGEEGAQTRLPVGMTFESSRRLYFSHRGVVSPATITIRKGGMGCNVFISLYGRTRQRCWNE